MGRWGFPQRLENLHDFQDLEIVRLVVHCSNAGADRQGQS
jgi:hypothetical protein